MGLVVCAMYVCMSVAVRASCRALGYQLNRDTQPPLRYSILSLPILTYNDRTVTHLHMMMILSGAWPQAMAWRGPACGRKASAGASRPAGPGYGLREIQGRESSGLAAEPLVVPNKAKCPQHVGSPERTELRTAEC